MTYLLLRFRMLSTPTTAIPLIILAVFLTASTHLPKEPNMAGNYSGYILMENGTKKVSAGLVVTALEDDEYEATLYLEKVPWEQENSVTEPKTVKLSGTYTNYTLRLSGNFPLEFQFIHNRFTALDKSNTYRGHLEKVIHVSDKT